MNPNNKLSVVLFLPLLSSSFASIAIAGVTNPYAPREAVSYRLTVLGDFSGGADLSTAMDINESGQIVGSGWTSEGQRAAYWHNGTMYQLDGLGGNRSAAVSINESGQIAGYSAVPDNSTRSVIWSNGTSAPVSLGDLYGGLIQSSGTDINDSGQAAGFSESSTGTRAFFWENGVMTNLGELTGGGNRSVGIALNNNGEVVGWSEAASGPRGFLSSGGVMTDLGDLPGGRDESYASDINDMTQVVGYSGGQSGLRAFLWQEGVMRDLGIIADYISSRAEGINNYGEVVGALSRNSFGDDHAFIWSESYGMLDLNDQLLEYDFSMGVFTLKRALGINDVGQIVGYGSYGTGSGQLAFLLDPITTTAVPLPHAMYFLMSGLAVLGLKRKSPSRTD